MNGKDRVSIRQENYKGYIMEGFIKCTKYDKDWIKELKLKNFKKEIFKEK